jgi:DNA polymerase-3 subunit alpha
MQIASAIGGFSMSESDNLRKAMGKKQPEEMAKYKEKFVAGAKARNHDEKFARELFETMEYFAGYGFNKSHSTAYALVTYQTAWLKAHHPVEFTAANLTVESSNSDKIKEFADEARRAGIKLLPPSVNHSQRYFAVEHGTIRYGLGAVKGMGTRAAELVAQERRRGGPYASLEDLCERHDANVLGKTALEALAQAGALDGLGRSRRGNFESIESALRSSAVTREDRRRGQRLLFATAPPVAATVAAGTAADGSAEPGSVGRSGAARGPAEWPEHERLAREKAALGFYLSGHPFEKRGTFLKKLAGSSTAALAGLAAGTHVRIAGMVSSVRVMPIKQGKNAGQKMARFLLEDLEGQVHVTCFARAYTNARDRIVEDAIVFLSGRIDGQSEERAVLLDLIEPASEVVRREVAGLVVRLEASDTQEGALQRLREIVDRFRGQQLLHLDVIDQGHCHRVRTDSGIQVSDAILDELALLVGPENLSFTRT